MKTFNKVMAKIQKPLNVTVFLVFIVMILVMLMQIIARYVFKHGFPWSEELARYGLVWLVFFGTAIVHVKRDNHMSMNVLEEIVGPKFKKILKICQEIIMFVFCGFIVYFAFKTLPGLTKSLTPGLKVAFFYPYLTFPISGIVMVIASVNRIANLFWNESSEVEEVQK